MVKPAYFLLLFFLSFACNEPEPAPLPPDPLDDGILKVLFVGNSHTYYNDLPITFEQLVKSSGFSDSIMVKMSAPGGSTLEEHSDDLSATSVLLQNHDFDWVILQENAFSAAQDEATVTTTITPFAQKLKNLIKEENEGTNILLYLTHAYKEGISDCATSPTICTYDLMQNELRRTYIDLGKTLNTEIAPAGMIWKILRSVNPFDLWDADKVHPNALGSYVSALTIFTSILDQRLTADQYVPVTVDQAQRPLILKTINEVIFENSPDWRQF